MEVTVRPEQARELDGNTANLADEMLPLKDSIHREYILLFHKWPLFQKVLYDDNQIYDWHTSYDLGYHLIPHYKHYFFNE